MSEESTTYNASMESIRIPDSRRIGLPDIPVNVKSPVLEFHDMHFHVQADMNGWMTINEQDRLSRTTMYADMLTPLADKKAEEQRLYRVDNYRMNASYRHRILLAIFNMESAHPYGSRKVAVLVVNALFPKAEK